MTEEEEYQQTYAPLNTEIIKKLVAEAPSEEVKDTLLLYDVKKDGKTIKKDLTSSDIKNLAAAAEFLKISNAKKIKTNSTLAGKVLQAIENLLMQKCGNCTQYYSIQFGEPPALACRKCGQGAHPECYDDHQVRVGITLVYTCSLCKTSDQPPEPNPAIPNNQLLETPVDRPASVPDESGENEDEEEEDSEFKYEITENTCRFFLKTRCKNGIKGTNCKYDQLTISLYVTD